MNRLSLSTTLLIILLLSNYVSSYAQMHIISNQPRQSYGGFWSREVLIYRSIEDSIMIAKCEEMIAAQLKIMPLQQKKVDSLVYLHSQQMENGITGIKITYYPSHGYLPFDSLSFIKDKSTITRLSVNAQNVRALWPEIIKCTNLTILELVNCEVKALTRELNQLKSLRKIQILNNTSVRKLKLKKNHVVRELAFRGDNPRSLPRSFKKYDSLTKIDLSQNKLTRFTNAARHNRKLIELDLQRNKITLKQNNIKPHPWAERIGFQTNRISYVPSSVKNFSNAKKLGFNHNQITDVASSIGKLRKLEELSFYNNKLEAVPEGVYNIRSLKMIDLFHNRIFKLEDKIINWKKLHTLYASHNHLTYLPSVINQLPELHEIYVYDNSLKELPATLCQIEQLKVLRFNINEVKELPLCFEHLKNLEELDLSDNSITDLPAALFRFPKLKILAIVDNPWNEKFRNGLPAMVKKLREQNVSVHLDSYGDEPEK